MAKAAPEWAKKKLKQMEEAGAGGDFLNLNDGSNVVRILPSWRGEGEEFFKEAAYHYKIGPEKKTVLCARSVGKKCFLCDESDRLFKSGDKDGAKALRAKKRYFVNAIDLNSKEKKVQTLPFGATVLKALLKYLIDADEEWGEWWHKKGRYDFKIEKTGEGLDTEYTVFPTRKFKDVDTSKAVAKDLDANAGEPPTVAEQKALYEGTEVDEDEDTEDTEEEDGEEESSPAEKKKAKKKAAKKALDEELSDDESEGGDDEEETEDEDEDAEEDDGEESEEEAEEDDGEEADESEESEDEEEADEASDGGDGSEEPACFADPAEHNPTDDICKECDWKEECGAKVQKKIAKDPKKYADAPLVKLAAKKAKSGAAAKVKEAVKPKSKEKAKAGKPVKKGKKAKK